MRITDLLDKRSIAFDKNPANKQETLDMAVDLMCASGKINLLVAIIQLGTLARLPVINRRKVGMTSNHHAPYDLGYTRATMVGTTSCESVTAS